MDLTITIVNWNVKEYLRKCLDSIFRYADKIDLEVIVVDNASKDSSVTMLRNEFSQVTLIENNKNLGYGCALNQAIKIAKGRYLLFLNPDTEMLADTLLKIIEFMDMHQESGACSCIEIKRKEEVIIPLNKFSYRWWLFCKYIYSKFPNNLTRHYYMNFVVETIQSFRDNCRILNAQFLENGFVFVRKEALSQVGGFNPKFFFGNEARDLTIRIKKMGWKLYVVPWVRIIHYDGKSREQLSDSELLDLVKDWQKHNPCSI